MNDNKLVLCPGCMKETSVAKHSTEPDGTSWSECCHCAMVFSFEKNEFTDFSPINVMAAPSSTLIGFLTPGTIFFAASYRSIDMLKVKNHKGPNTFYDNPVSKGEWSSGQWKSGVCPSVQFAYSDNLLRSPYFATLEEAEAHVVKLNKEGS